MEHIPLRSSTLRSGGYEPRTNTLEIQFHSGDTYQYFAVPLNLFERLVEISNNGGSVGSYFDLHVKKAGYVYKQIN